MFPDATQAGTSCTFDGFRDDGDRGDSTFLLKLKLALVGIIPNQTLLFQLRQR